MKLETSYDATFTPPAPVVAMTLEGPSGTRLLLPMLLDTGADCSLIPDGVAHALNLPRVDVTTIEGVAGGSRRASVHAAWLLLGKKRSLVRLVAFEGEAILGRDLLEPLVAQLDGPRRRLTLTRPSRKGKHA